MVLRKIAIAVVIVLGCGRVSPADDSGEGKTTECAPVPAAEIPPLDTPDVCTAYLGNPPPSGTDVQVAIVSDRDEPILLVDQSSGCNQPARWFQLDGEHEGHTVRLERYRRSCRVSRAVLHVGRRELDP